MSRSAVSKFFFGPTQEERVKQVQSQLRSEQRALDREIRQIDTAVAKSKAEVKKLAKKGDVKNARVLAREVVRSAKQKNRLHTSKARLNSINMQLGQQLAMYKVTGTMSKSVEVMKLSNQLVKLPQVSKAMREMSMELTKAGIMEEMLDDTLAVSDEEELEEEAQGEVDRILFELTDGKLGQADAGKAGLADLDLEAPQAAQPANAEDEDREREDLKRMQDALDGLLRG